MCSTMHSEIILKLRGFNLKRLRTTAVNKKIFFDILSSEIDTPFAT